MRAHPAFLSSMAATAESTPPEMATAISPFVPCPTPCRGCFRFNGKAGVSADPTRPMLGSLLGVWHPSKEALTSEELASVLSGKAVPAETTGTDVQLCCAEAGCLGEAA